MIALDPRDSRPINEQLQENFSRLITGGVLAEGEKLPSVRQLAAQLAINPNTIQRAYASLEAEGYVVSHPGKGSFVASLDENVARRKADMSRRLRPILAELIRLGMTREELLSLYEEETGGSDK